MSDDIELEKIRLERDRMESDAALRSEELKIRRAELEARLEDDQKKRVIRFTPAVTGAIVVAVLTFLGTVIAGIVQGISGYLLESKKLESEIILEREKFESGLILKAVEGKSRKESAENLKFFLEAGLLESRKKKLAVLVAQPEKIPTIEPIEARLARMEIQVTALECENSGRVFDVSTLKCTEVPFVPRK